MKATLLPAQNLSKIKDLIIQGIQCWEEAGRLLVQALEEGTTIAHIAATTETPPGVLYQLERIGRKQIIPRLLISDFPAARALERLPYSEQVRLQNDSVEILISDATGKPTTILLRPQEMTRDQVKQAFDSGHCRSLAEQKAWLMDRATKKLEDVVTIQGNYKIKGSKVIFPSPCEMSRSTLARILAEME